MLYIELSITCLIFLFDQASFIFHLFIRVYYFSIFSLQQRPAAASRSTNNHLRILFHISNAFIYYFRIICTWVSYYYYSDMVRKISMDSLLSNSNPYKSENIYSGYLSRTIIMILHIDLLVTDYNQMFMQV